jgi:putative hydrolase of the HAD superfamily
MIENIIFDLGNVVFKLKFEKVIKEFTQNEEEIKLLESVIFSSEEWLKLDEGTITKQEGIDIMISKLPINLHEVCRKIMNSWTDLGLELNNSMLNFIKKVREKGYRTYILSNAPLEIPIFLEKLDLLQYFDGKIISAEEKLVKPNLEIYKLLLKKFNLNPKKCLFIDDKLENIESAINCNINGYVFDYNRFNQFLNDIKKYNIII